MTGYNNLIKETEDSKKYCNYIIDILEDIRCLTITKKFEDKHKICCTLDNCIVTLLNMK